MNGRMKIEPYISERHMSYLAKNCGDRGYSDVNKMAEAMLAIAIENDMRGKSKLNLAESHTIYGIMRQLSKQLTDAAMSFQETVSVMEIDMSSKAR